MLKELSAGAKKRAGFRWCDLTSFIVYEVVELNHDIAYCKLEDYKNGEAFNEDDDSKIFYAFNEDDAWNQLFKITNTTDYQSLEKLFLNARWCDLENALVFELKNNELLMALRL